MYLTFANPRQKTIETMNISHLCRNNVNIALANYLMKSLKSTCLYFSVFVVGFYQTHLNEITNSVSISFVSIMSLVYTCYILVPYKWNKENVIITFRSYVRIILGSCNCNGTRTHNQLVRKRTLNHLAKLVILPKWLSVFFF